MLERLGVVEALINHAKPSGKKFKPHYQPPGQTRRYARGLARNRSAFGAMRALLASFRSSRVETRPGKQPELSPRTFCTFLRELSSRRRDAPHRP